MSYYLDLFKVACINPNVTFDHVWFIDKITQLKSTRYFLFSMQKKKLIKAVKQTNKNLISYP